MKKPSVRFAREGNTFVAGEFVGLWSRSPISGRYFFDSFDGREHKKAPATNREFLEAAAIRAYRRKQKHLTPEPSPHDELRAAFLKA